MASQMQYGRQSTGHVMTQRRNNTVTAAPNNVCVCVCACPPALIPACTGSFKAAHRGWLFSQHWKIKKWHHETSYSKNTFVGAEMERAGFRLSPDQSASFYFSWRLFQALQMETVSTQVKFQLTREMVCCSRLPPSGEYCVVYMI